MLTENEASVSQPNGIIDRIGQKVRANMHGKFIHAVMPRADETILDVGASANSAYVSSNYLGNN